MTMTRGGLWTRRLSKWSLRLGVIAIVLIFGGALLGRFDVIPKLTAVSMMFGGGALSFLGVIIAVIAIVLNVRNRTGFMMSALVGLLLSGGLAGFMASRAAIAGKVPAIHDITTDLANPPAFTKLTLAADNLRGVETIENWRTMHAKAYGDIKPVTIAKPVSAVIATAEKLARARGWSIAHVDQAQGVLEATASVSLIQFQDDVILRVTPGADGMGSRVDMRSVSRVGVSDLGVNAKRVREFLDALSAG